jgi:hypothetical protein
VEFVHVVFFIVAGGDDRDKRHEMCSVPEISDALAGCAVCPLFLEVDALDQRRRPWLQPVRGARRAPARGREIRRWHRLDRHEPAGTRWGTVLGDDVTAAALVDWAGRDAINECSPDFG